MALEDDDSLGVRWSALRAAEAALDIDHEVTNQVLTCLKDIDGKADTPMLTVSNPTDMLPALIYASHALDKNVRKQALKMWADLATRPAIVPLNTAGLVNVRTNWPVETPLDDDLFETIRTTANTSRSMSAILDGIVDRRLWLEAYIPLIVEALGAETSEVRAMALAKSLPIASRLVPLIAEASNCGDPRLRLRAVHAIALMAPQNEEAAEQLISFLDYAKKDVSGQAIIELGCAGDAAKPALGKLIEIADSKEESAGTAILALSTLGEVVARDEINGEHAIEVISRRALDKNDPLFPSSAVAWARIAPGANPRQIDALLAVGKMPGSPFRSMAIDALFMQPRNAELVPAMTSLLDETDNGVRLRAVEVLGDLGADAKPAGARLSRMVDNQLGILRQAAARALVRVDPTPSQLAQAYIAAVRNNDLVAQATLAQSIRRSPESSDRTSARLTELATADPDENVRTHAKSAMEAIGK
jgi:HEAT repeat protein